LHRQSDVPPQSESVRQEKERKTQDTSICCIETISEGVATEKAPPFKIGNRSDAHAALMNNDSEGHKTQYYPESKSIDAATMGRIPYNKVEIARPRYGHVDTAKKKKWQDSPTYCVFHFF
jgi:hypothetical protein